MQIRQQAGRQSRQSLVNREKTTQHSQRTANLAAGAGKQTRTAHMCSNTLWRPCVAALLTLAQLARAQDGPGPLIPSFGCNLKDLQTV